MQLIRPHQIFRLLGDHAVHGRQEFRTDRRVKYIQKHVLEFHTAAGVRIILHQMAHQRLWHAGIDAVHRHVVAVVGGPSQSQFRHIPGPDDQAARAVGDIHQDLGALSGLSVFIGHIMILCLLSDIPEMHRHRFFDIHFLQRRPQGARHLAGIIVGSVRGAEARHGHGRDLPSVQSQHIKSTHRHQKRQRRVQSARNPDYRRLTACMLISFLKAAGLNGQNLLTPPRALLLVRRHERPAPEAALQRRLFFLHGNRYHKINPAALRPVAHHPPSFMLQPVKIQIRIEILRRKAFRLRQHRPVLRDHVMAAEDQILGGLAFPRRSVDIARDQLRAGRLHQHFPVHILAYGLVGSRQVHQHRGSRQRMSRARRQGRPQILAQLAAHRQAAHRIHREQDVGPHRHLFSMKKINLRFFIARHEMSCLIELRIGRDITLRDKGQHFSVLQHRRHIVELVAHLQRQSHEHKRITAFRGIRHHVQRFPRLHKQQLLQKKVAACIACNAQLRKDDNLRPFCICLFQSFTDLARIVRRIRHPDLRGHRRRLDKSMFHELSRLSLSLCLSLPV